MPTRQLNQQIAVIIVLDADRAVRAFLAVGVFVEFHEGQLHDLLFSQAGVLGVVYAHLLHQVLDYSEEWVAGRV
jgi:hypothetical protein